MVEGASYAGFLVLAIEELLQRRFFGNPRWTKLRRSHFGAATKDPCSFFGAEEASRLDKLCGGVLSHPDSGTYELGWDYGEVFNITPHSVGVMCLR